MTTRRFSLEGAHVVNEELARTKRALQMEANAKEQLEQRADMSGEQAEALWEANLSLLEGSEKEMEQLRGDLEAERRRRQNAEDVLKESQAQRRVRNPSSMRRVPTPRARPLRRYTRLQPGGTS